MSILDGIEIKTGQYPWKSETITAIGTLRCGTELDFDVGAGKEEIKHHIRCALSDFIYGEINGAISNALGLMQESMIGLSTADNRIVELSMLRSALDELENARKLCR